MSSWASELLSGYLAVVSFGYGAARCAARAPLPDFAADLAGCKTLGIPLRIPKRTQNWTRKGAGDAFTYVSDHSFVGASAAVAARTNSYSKTPEHED